MIPVAQIENKLSEKNKVSNTTSANSNQPENKAENATTSKTSTQSNQTQNDEPDSNKRRGSIGTYLYSSNLKPNEKAYKKMRNMNGQIVNSK